MHFNALFYQQLQSIEILCGKTLNQLIDPHNRAEEDEKQALQT